MNGSYKLTAPTNKPHKILHSNGVFFRPEEIRKVAVEVIELLKDRNLSYAEAEIILDESLKLLDTETKL